VNNRRPRVTIGARRPDSNRDGRFPREIPGPASPASGGRKPPVPLVTHDADPRRGANFPGSQTLFGNPLSRNSVSHLQPLGRPKRSFGRVRSQTGVWERGNGSQPPVWEPTAAKLRFAPSTLLAPDNGVSGECVPKRRLGTRGRVLSGAR